MHSSKKLNILITGCSDGGMGAALAAAFHHSGHHVFATTRDPSKMSSLAAQGIETLAVDVTSAASVAAAVRAVSSSLPNGRGLDMLINNAGRGYTMPLMDVSLDEAKATFDLNVWAHIAVTQAFLPLLLRSATAGRAPAVVNNTSVSSVAALPFLGVYSSSKSALAMLTETLRFELAPLGVRVVELKTGNVRTNIISNLHGGSEKKLPAESVYAPAREIVERSLRQEDFVDYGVPAERWAAEVSALLLARNPPAVVWKGENAFLGWLGTILPRGWLDGYVKKLSGLDKAEEILKESRK